MTEALNKISSAYQGETTVTGRINVMYAAEVCTARHA